MNRAALGPMSRVEATCIYLTPAVKMAMRMDIKYGEIGYTELRWIDNVARMLVYASDFLGKVPLSASFMACHSVMYGLGCWMTVYSH